MEKAAAVWSVKKVDSLLVAQLCEQYGIEPIVAQLLVQRGYTSEEQVVAQLGDGRAHWHNPFLLAGMQEAIDYIQMAVQEGQLIRVFGDYDADGVSATAFAAKLLAKIGAKYDTYIPHRQREGYGLNVDAVELAAAQGVKLVLTVDNGISAHAAIARARELGLRVVVTDHHEPPAELPQADVLVNPKLVDCSYPFKGLAGVGVMAKLAEALLGIRDGEPLPDELAQIVPIGTVADVMPLVDENRRFVKQGIEALQRAPLPGLQALLKEAGVQLADLSATHFGFAIGPRMNASGRLDSAQPSLDLLLAKHAQEGQQYAEQLTVLNQKRQRLVEEVNQAALAQVQAEYGDQLPGCIVVADAAWHPGVVGIAAAKLVEITQRPTFVLGIDVEKGIAKGSGRSNQPFDLHKALVACDDLLTHYGGHHAAAGVSLAQENLAAFRERLAKIADEHLCEADFAPAIEADLFCELHDVKLSTIDQLQQLAPFGAGNPSPTFFLSGIVLQQIKTMGKQNQHLKLTVTARNITQPLDVLAFNKAHWAEDLKVGQVVEMVCEFDVNEWNNQRKPQLMLQAIRPIQRHGIDWRGIPAKDQRIEQWLSLHEADRVLAIDFDNPLPKQAATSTHVLFRNRPQSLTQLQDTLHQLPHVQTWVGWFGPTPAEDASFGLPSRDRFKRLYQELQQQPRIAIADEALKSFAQRVGEQPQTLLFMLHVFEELAFVAKQGNAFVLAEQPGKAALETSTLYQKRKQAGEVDDLLTYEQSNKFIAWMEAHFAFAEHH